MLIYTKIKGFSIIELMIAIAITAIIISISTYSYISYMNKAKIAHVFMFVEQYKVLVLNCVKEEGVTKLGSGSTLSSKCSRDYEGGHLGEDIYGEAAISHGVIIYTFNKKAGSQLDKKTINFLLNLDKNQTASWKCTAYDDELLKMIPSSYDCTKY